MKKLLFVLFASLSATGALACTPGAGNGPSGDPNCMGGVLSTDPYYNRNQGSTQPPQKIIRHVTVNVPSKYGALAVNTEKAKVGSSLNMASVEEAKKAAIQSCQNGDTSMKCTIIDWYRNGCISAASGTKGEKNTLFRAIGESSGKVESLALAKCQKAGHSNCSIVVSEQCSLP